jgi:hypothetical protein
MNPSSSRKSIYEYERKTYLLGLLLCPSTLIRTKAPQKAKNQTTDCTVPWYDLLRYFRVHTQGNQSQHSTKIPAHSWLLQHSSH